LEVDIAELSLGQRLAAGVAHINNNTARPPGKAESGKSGQEGDSIPVSSLSRTLTQALHSSDSRLLELCLAHSNPATVQNTVERLSPQFAVPLLDACVQRLGRGHRGTNLKGGGGGASSQRGMALITWIRAVLLSHSGHLMAVGF
jgi:U3 small nucleolar RNA-associated protein 5